MITKSDIHRWGEFIAKHIHYADEIGENVLHRFSEFGYTEAQPATDKVLCPDMPAKLRRVENVVTRLRAENHLRAMCVIFWYCAPLKADGRIFTKSELARILQINKGKFRAELRKGEKFIISVKIA